MADRVLIAELMEPFPPFYPGSLGRFFRILPGRRATGEQEPDRRFESLLIGLPVSVRGHGSGPPRLCRRHHECGSRISAYQVPYVGERVSKGMIPDVNGQ